VKVALLFGIVVVLVMSSNSAAAWKFRDWSVPTNLGPLVNSDDSEGAPALSADRLSLYLGSNRPGGFGLFDIWVSQRARTTQPWGPAIHLGPPINTANVEFAPFLSHDGHWMFLNSNRPGGFGQIDLWVSYRPNVHDHFGWQTPVNLGPGVNSPLIDQGSSYFENGECDDDDDDDDDERDGRRHATGGSRLGDDDDDEDDDDDDCIRQLFFGSNRPGGIGGSDIYVSSRLHDGSFGAAELVEELSSPVGDLRPAVRFDGLELFLFSTRPGGFGDYDLWVSARRTVSDPWTRPVNLGPIVNSQQDDQHGYMASDRRTLYFASSRPGSLGGLDLYVTIRMRR